MSTIIQQYDQYALHIASKGLQQALPPYFSMGCQRQNIQC